MSHATTKIAKRLTTAEPGSADKRLRWLLIAAMTCVTLYMLISGVFETPEVRENFTNSGSTSPGGHRALAELLRQNGYKISTTVQRLDRLEDEFFKPYGRVLALLEPSPMHTEENEGEIRALFADERHANVVLVLPKRHYIQKESEEEGGPVVLEEYVYPLSECRRVLEYAGMEDELEFHRAMQALPFTDAEGKFETTLAQGNAYPQYFEIKNKGVDLEEVPLWQTLVKTKEGNPVVVRNKSRNLTVVADPDLLSNRFIGKGEAATLARIVFSSAGSRDVAIDEAMHGLATEASLEYLAVRPPALWALLSLLLLLGLFYWRESTVLRPAEAEAEQRRSRALVIEGVAKLMARARDYGSAARAALKRAQFALVSSRAHVHAAGISGSTATGLPQETEQRLEAIRFARGTEEGLVQVARAISELKLEQSLAKHIPPRNQA
jgi:hypothetical protein